MPAVDRSWLFGLPLLLLVAGVAYGPGQGDFWWLLGLYAPAFLLYAAICHKATEAQLPSLLLLAALLRIAVWPAMPQLSDDVYRFIWDGRLLLNGINPFEQIPAYYAAQEQLPSGLSQALFEQLNSPEYFTVYPPVAQGVFAFACWLAPDSVYGSALIMKSFLLACELGSLWLLPKLLRELGLPQQRALWYLLNPLMVLEITGNLHFEGAMVFFLLLALWWAVRGQWVGSALAMALSVAAKLLPLLFLFFFIRRLGWKRSLAYFSIMGLALLLLFAPLLSGAFLQGFGSSLDLYFRQFEFNGSVYYLLRWLGYQWAGYNLIATLGPALALCTFTGISLAALLERGQSWRSLFPLMLFAICLYLAFTPTVHPWYVCLPLLLCCFTRYRFPVAWSALIVLTYINYSYADGYREVLWIVALEYLAVASMAVWESLRQSSRPALGV